MKLLHEASVVFQLHEDEDGNLILGATLVTDELKPGSTKASVAALAAASAYGLYLNGTVAKTAKEVFSVDLQRKPSNGPQAGDGSTPEGRITRTTQGREDA